MQSQHHESIGQQLLTAVNKLTGVPGGQFILSKLIAHRIPYSATIGARIIELQPGHAKLQLKDKKFIRNHLNSIHAVALTNFGELTSGLTLITSLPDNVRGIVTHLSTDFLKKARGTLLAECHCAPPSVTQDMDFHVETKITDQAQDVVAVVKTTWRLGLRS